jgi:hypothetical protein
MFGLKGLGLNKMPEPDMSVGDVMGYHIRTGKHDITPLSGIAIWFSQIVICLTEYRNKQNRDQMSFIRAQLLISVFCVVALC